MGFCSGEGLSWGGGGGLSRVCGSTEFDVWGIKGSLCSQATLKVIY